MDGKTHYARGCIEDPGKACVEYVDENVKNGKFTINKKPKINLFVFTVPFLPMFL